MTLVPGSDVQNCKCTIATPGVMKTKMSGPGSSLVKDTELIPGQYEQYCNCQVTTPGVMKTENVMLNRDQIGVGLASDFEPISIGSLANRDARIVNLGTQQ